MNDQPASGQPEVEQRIAALLRTIREAERELQNLNGGQADASGNDRPFFLREAEERYRLSESALRQLLETQSAILTALPANIALLNSQGVIVSVNEAWRRGAHVNTLQSDDLGVGQNYLQIWEAQGKCSVETSQVAEGIRGVLNGTSPKFTLEYSCNTHSQPQWFQLVAAPLNGGQPGGAVIIHTDITERKRAEERLGRINRLYAVLSRVNETIVRTKNQRELFEQVCRIAVEKGRFMLAVVMTLDEQTGDVRPLTHADMEDGPFEAVTINIFDPKLSCGTVGTAIRTKIFDVCNDLVNAPRMDAWRETYLRQGHRSTASFPILNEGKVMGTFTLVSGETNYFQEDEIELLTAIQNDLSFAVEALQKEGKKQQAEEALKQSQLMLRIAGRVARLGGWMIHLPEHKLIWSDETCLIHDQPPGYQPTFEEGINMFPPEYRAEVVRLVDACMREGTPYEFVVPKITAKGRQIWVRSLGEAVRDAEGKIVRLQGAFQDITERKLADMELFKLNRALRMLSACGDALTRTTDEKQLLTEVCRLAVDIGGYRMAWVGYAEDDVVRSIRPIAHAGDEQGYLSRIKLSWSEQDEGGRGPAGQTIRSGQVVVYEDITHNSARFNFLEDAQSRGYRGVICLPLRDENRTFGLVALYSSDISKPGADELELLQKLADDLAFGVNNLRTRAEHRKAQQEVVQQAALLDKARDAIIVCDLRRRIKFWNKGAEQVYGWNVGEVLDRSASDILCPQLSAFWPAFQALFQKGEWAGELQKKTKDGRNITVDCRWTLVRNERQEPDSVLCIETDITERKKLEAQFLRAQRMESIGTLAGGIAHDLNNVLSPILMSVSLLKPKMPDRESEDVLETLHKSAQRGADLVQQVLSFARGIEGQRVDVNLFHLLREIQSVVRDTFPKSMVFELEAANDLRSVAGDPTQLHQVFLNLCVNARDAMPAGGELSITMENVALDETNIAMNPGLRPGPYVLVQVGDTGSGIAPELLDRIFEPFFTTKELGRGTGLGLSTAMSIVKSHGGFIQVHSESGRGTIFKVYLPANSSPAVAVQGDVGEQTQLLRGNGELVLVVDDEESVRKIAQSILERSGYRVLLASHGAEAVSLYTEHQAEVAVVLTDMAMPVMDGPALIDALKTMNAQVRVIGSSGFASAANMARITEAGVRHFLTKPYKADALLRILHEALVE